jgi:hypothetical protein
MRLNRTQAALMTMLLLSLIGCRDPVTWSTDCLSPDRTWIAIARTVEHGGFGTAGVETTVEIKRSNNSGSPDVCWRLLKAAKTWA